MTTIKTARRIVDLKRGRNAWYRIENSAGSVADVWIYDEIGYFGVTASDFVRELQGITAKSMTLHMNSPGGDVFDALAIYNALRNHEADITVRIEGVAASAASFIAMAGDTIIAEKASEMMIHDARAMGIGLTAPEMRDLADLLDKNSDIVAGIYADRAGGDVANWRSAMIAETWYNSDEMLAAGLVDEIAGVSASTDSAVAANWDLSIFAYSGRAAAPSPLLPGRTNDESPNGGFEFDPELFRAAVKEAVS